MKAQRLTIEDVRTMLKSACESAGTQQQWARENGLSAPYVSDVISGWRAPAEQICAALGLRRVVEFEREPQKVAK